MERLMATQPDKLPAQPTYILRGHIAQIHAVTFFRHNSRLLTGDADGWVVLWSTTTKRGVAVWQAHKDTILGLGSWDDDKIITHGRDNRVHVWQLKPDDEAELTTVLPIDDLSGERKQPHLLHSLTVNALNFCAFATHHVEGQNDILIAIPGVQDGYINITSLPTETRVATIPTPKDTNTGMLMATDLHIVDDDNGRALLALAGYESGHVCVWRQQTSRLWTPTYISEPHAQPVLSLGIAASQGFFFSSSADAIIARHPLLPRGEEEPTTLQTRHAGQQSLTVRSDEKIYATAGWDGRIRVYSTKSMAELAVLKWHKEGCYAVGFAEVASQPGPHVDETTLTTRAPTVSTLRTRKAETTHWIAAGSKDGKVSLWDIY